MSTLVIVESPTKAKTISKFLGRGYIVRSSFGHVRDLPKSKMGIDVAHNFLPTYTVNKDKSAVVKELKTLAAKADHVLFATDEDREGEAISWHLATVLGIPPAEAERITFHEITKEAITKAIANPRAIDLKLVDAQQARRVLDRLVGYELSPFLWRKVARGLSAGRVQSVAVRLVVEREREIQAFKIENYWTIEGEFSTKEASTPFPAKLISTPEGKLEKMSLNEKSKADAIVAALQNVSYSVSSAEKKEQKREPSAPFTTSTLQQDANQRLGYSAKQTMRLAQQLYEGVELGSDGSVGLITYMRTDALNLSESFLTASHDLIAALFGKEYQLSAPRLFKNKSKNAQEAHEAIRPTNPERTPESIQPYVSAQQFKLYDLIWRRAVATQMSAARIEQTSAMLVSANNYTFKATGQSVIFEGFLRLYPEKNKETLLPLLKIGSNATCHALTAEAHETEPPARYSDATLVKVLEEYGVGRPSTFAPTIGTIEDRGYVERDDKKRLFPKDIAYLVNDLLTEHFTNIVDYEFTAGMEETLDKIALGEETWQPVIAAFYHPFKETLERKEKELTKKDLTEETTDELCTKCNKPMIIKVGRFGKFMACSGYPECKNTKPMNGEVDITTAELTSEVCEKCGAPMARKVGRFGPFLGCSGYPECKNIKRIERKLGIACPLCTQGYLIEKTTKRRRTFFGCNRYPDCDFSLWDKPTGEKCPKCQHLLVHKAKKIKCSSAECDYEQTPTP